MKTVEEFLEKTEIDFPYFIYKDTIKEWLKEYTLEIASDAFDAGFAYGNNPKHALNKSEYSQKLHNEL